MRRILTSRALFGVLVVVAGANLVMFALERYVATPLRVPGRSMTPELHPGDRILAAPLRGSATHVAGDLQRGDIVVFHAPEPGAPLVVKRVIGLPGEQIEARDGLIAIDNSNVLDEWWLPASRRSRDSAAARSVDIDRTRLAADEVYVLGDNRLHSIDSRSYGAIDADRIVGRVRWRIWPLTRSGTVGPA